MRQAKRGVTLPFGGADTHHLPSLKSELMSRAHAKAPLSRDR
jgi:hypothetical protein